MIRLPCFVLVWVYLSLFGPASAVQGLRPRQKPRSHPALLGPPAAPAAAPGTPRIPGHPTDPRPPGQPGHGLRESQEARAAFYPLAPFAPAPSRRRAWHRGCAPGPSGLSHSPRHGCGRPESHSSGQGRVRRSYWKYDPFWCVRYVLFWKAQMGICVCLSRKQEWFTLLHPQHLCFLELDRQQEKSNPSSEGPKVWLEKPNESSALQAYFSSELCDDFTKTFVFISPQSSHCCYCYHVTQVRGWLFLLACA